MKYAKKFRVVPYTTETPALSQIASTFNTALTTKTYPDEKVKIYNQALSKIKEMKAENIPPPPTVENNNYEINKEIEGEDEEKRNVRIAKEIAELEKRNAQDISSKTLVDYSNSDKVSKYKRKKPQFDTDKFIQLLDELIENSNLTKSKVEAIQQLLPPSSYNNISKNLFSTPWGSRFKDADWSMSFNSQLNPSTVGKHNTNYLTNISGVSPNPKKRKSEIMPLYNIDENSSDENSPDENPQPSNRTSFYIPKNDKNKLNLPKDIDLDNLIYTKRTNAVPKSILKPAKFVPKVSDESLMQVDTPAKNNRQNTPKQSGVKQSSVKLQDKNTPTNTRQNQQPATPKNNHQNTPKQPQHQNLPKHLQHQPTNTPHKSTKRNKQS